MNDSTNPPFDTDGVDLRLSAQQALLGNIPASLRAVSVEYRAHQIACRCVFDGPPTEDDQELLSCAMTEMLADYREPYTLEEEYLYLSYPMDMSHLQYLVFWRYEPPPISEWIQRERQKVYQYFEQAGVMQPQIEASPSFCMEGCVAIWKVVSTMTQERHEWWAISGDLPLGYLPARHLENAREALHEFIHQWNDDMRIGNIADQDDVMQLLEIRLPLLRQWATNDELWSSR